MYKITEEGKKYLNEGFPEVKLISILKGPMKIVDVKNKIENFNIALQWAKKHGWVEIKGDVIVPIKKPGKKKPQEQIALENLIQGKEVKDDIISILLKRNLIKRERKQPSLLGGSVNLKELKEVSRLTHDLIKTGLWKKVKLKPYNVEIIGRKVYPGKKHVITYYTEKIREIFFDMGFKEAEGPLIESSFWNFDALYQPQDHPARELADTFYIKKPNICDIPEKRLVDAVKAAHENGGNTGSRGWGYKWKYELARKPVLRTHTTPVSARSLAALEPPAKIFCIGKVFRNETIDYKHLCELTQVEGIVVDENVSFRDLLGYLKEFYLRMGFEKIRFRPAYFPYTEMSVEPEVYFKNKKEWIELGGAGIFRPEVTRPLGVDCPVLAWGLGLERMIMLRIGINDIREFHYKNDLRFLRSANPWL
jgi:phenylalanyl-tRNA synthetase alpha chain